MFVFILNICEECVMCSINYIIIYFRIICYSRKNFEVSFIVRGVETRAQHLILSVIEPF